MIRRILLLLFVVSAAVVGTPARGAGKEEPIIDWGSLNLKVTDIEIVDKIEWYLSQDGGPRQDKSITPQDGHDLVIVTMTSKNHSPSSYITTPGDFDAFYYDEIPGTLPRFLKPVASGTAAGITSLGFIRQEQSVGIASPSVKETGRFVLRLAFQVPNGVKELFVRVPLLVGGKTTIPSSDVSERNQGGQR